MRLALKTSSQCRLLAKVELAGKSLIVRKTKVAKRTQSLDRVNEAGQEKVLHHRGREVKGQSPQHSPIEIEESQIDNNYSKDDIITQREKKRDLLPFTFIH